MKSFFQKIIANPLFTGSMVMVVGSNLFNLGQFVYHFLSGRLLGKVYYGDLAVLISIIGIISIIQLSIGLTIVKFIASAKKKIEVPNLIKWFNLWAILLGGTVAILTLIFSPWLIPFLNLNQSLSFYMLVPLLFITVVAFTQRAILQGLLRFGKYVSSLFIEALTKIILTIVFVLAGFYVFGAMLGILIGVFFSLLFTWFSLFKFLSGKRGNMPKMSPLVKYSLPVFIQGLAFTSMYSTDLILVKHFFSASEAGIYASLAVLGRVALFFSAPVTQFMFPVVARRFSHGVPYHNIFYLAALFVVLMPLPIIAFYFFFPEFLIVLFYGKDFIEGASSLWWFGVFMGFLGLATLLSHFYLSIGKTLVVIPFALTAILQAVLIWFIHPNLLTVIKLSVFCAALLTLAFLVYFPWHDRKTL